VALNLYRRHRQECEAAHPLESRSGEFDERKKGWKRCACFIFASGTLGGKFKRRYTGKSEWQEAKLVVAQWEALGRWDAEIPPTPPPIADPKRITTEQSIKFFTTEFEKHAAVNTQKKYRLLLEKLKSFGESRGYVMLDQWTPIDIREMRSSWTVSQQTAAKNMSTIKAFFEFGLANEWITRNPARLVKRQRTRDGADTRNQQKLPFSDEELQRMYDACEATYGQQSIKWDRKTHHHQAKGGVAQYIRKWTGQDLADFISISVYTGLRISDVATFRSDRLQPSGEILIRTTKAGTHVQTWVPPWLQDRIRQRAEMHGPLIFGEHTTKDVNVITDVWRRKLIKLWDLCGPWKDKPTPHRFRHSFARILLERGVTADDVAQLLGNTPAIVRKHYAAWLSGRQARLTAILKSAFEDQPKPRSAALSQRPSP
jgi:integrase